MRNYFLCKPAGIAYVRFLQNNRTCCFVYRGCRFKMGESRSFFIEGLMVKFPLKPYQPQLRIISKIIKGLNKGENCLLESPTGTGKSLALLCSTLAWLEAEEDRVQRYNTLVDEGVTESYILDSIFNYRTARGATSSATEQNSTINATSNQLRGSSHLSHSGGSISDNSQIDATAGQDPYNSPLEGGFIRGGPVFHDDADGDFRDSPSRFLFSANAVESTLESLAELNETTEVYGVPPIQPNQIPNQIKKKRAPKIYFGTRTHKQIFQIMKELRRTEYTHFRSVVLGARDRTCIHPVVSRSRNVNEECRVLLDAKELPGQQNDFCSYYHGVNRMKTHDQAKNFGLRPAWDLEDLVKVGKRVKACPYFASRNLMETAQIIFCPYNYLIDPLIRQSMSIDLKGSVLVLDEAHNMEDCSREAASLVLEQEALLEAKKDLEKLSVNGFKPDSCQPLIMLLSRLSLWMEANRDKLNDLSDFEKTGKVFSGQEMVQHLHTLDVDPKSIVTLQKSWYALNDDNDEENDGVKPSAATSFVFSSLFQVLKYLFKDNMKFVDDYKVALISGQGFGSRRPVEGWLGRNRTPKQVYSLNFWCLNPGVAFSELGEMARSIILTSGTLSPMSSFESELQVKFDLKLEANHVIEKDQVFVTTLGRGPTNQAIVATYKQSETFAFQDELGRIVLDVCNTVPRGVLCFLPSYSMLDKIVRRWQSSNIWEEIKQTKVPLLEPRRADDFEESIKEFRLTIEQTRDRGLGEMNGALLLAVYRGKVSEGLDFSDDNARALIAVGIPFPNVKDTQVNLKRSYNDTYSKSRRLLSGSQWYEIQAFRALNQALGRCIRHQFDWGAIILVDCRYQQPTFPYNGQNRYVDGLSNWIRSSLKHEPCFTSCIGQLNQFAVKMVEKAARKRAELPDVTQSPKLMEADEMTSPPLQKSKEKDEDRLNPPQTTLPKFEFKNFSPDGGKSINTRLGSEGGANSATDLAIQNTQGLPLSPIRMTGTPFSGSNSSHSHPLTSTQIESNTQKQIESNTPKRLQPYSKSGSAHTSTPFLTTSKKLSSNMNNYPVFEICKKRNLSDLEDSRSVSSPRPDTDRKTGENSVVNSPEKENLYLSSDDMFAEDEVVEISRCNVERISIGLDQESDCSDRNCPKRRSSIKKRRKSSDTINSRAMNRTLQLDSDSDLDDFNLNTSLVGATNSNVSKAKVQTKGNRKGIVFTDYE